jgi:hypothetical protein
MIENEDLIIMGYDRKCGSFIILPIMRIVVPIMTYIFILVNFSW